MIDYNKLFALIGRVGMIILGAAGLGLIATQVKRGEKLITSPNSAELFEEDLIIDEVVSYTVEHEDITKTITRVGNAWEVRIADKGTGAEYIGIDTSLASATDLAHNAYEK